MHGSTRPPLSRDGRTDRRFNPTEGHILTQRRLISFKARTLMRKGFLIVRDPEARQERWKRADDFLRHPACLVVIGFALSGVLGSWLASVYQAKDRDRAAAVKSMDDLRSSIDDLLVTFDDYSTRALQVIDAKESGAVQEKIAAAQVEYARAKDKLGSRYLVDMPNIMQRNPNLDVGKVSMLFLEEVRAASVVLDACLNNGKVESAPGHNLYGKKLSCDFKIPGHPNTTADVKISKLTRCMTTFQMELRPDPRDDFDEPVNSALKASRAMSEVNKVCSLDALFSE
jgi:hypothetical protein